MARHWLAGLLARSFARCHLEYSYSPGEEEQSQPSQTHPGSKKGRRGTELTRTGTLSDDIGIDSNRTKHAEAVRKEETGIAREGKKARGERVKESPRGKPKRWTQRSPEPVAVTAGTCTSEA
ncbi:hypothetical protein K438DRAFT_1753562 [Mycena galopus ATCC 62051]|nr:hypothetical protein K438DRAFT_1753562 [Mycena galopus ATCC 62051]